MYDDNICKVNKHKLLQYDKKTFYSIDKLFKNMEVITWV